MKKITIIIFVLFISTLKTFGQNKSNHDTTQITTIKDSIEDSTSKWGVRFGHEKPGAVCVNGLEKLEIAYVTDRSMLAVNQLHFYGPGITQGRLFMQAEQEKEGKSSVHFFEATADLTVGEFPLHLGYTLGLDQFGKHPNVSYAGPAATIYWSDIYKVHHTFHILRTGMSYLSLSQHLVSKNGEDSTEKIGNEMEFDVFMQLQPIHLSHEVTLFSEGLLRMRKDNSFSEIEIGLRHEKVFNDLIGLGIRLDWKDFHFHSLSGVLRFNISNPNPRHLEKKLSYIDKRYLRVPLVLVSVQNCVFDRFAI